MKAICFFYPGVGRFLGRGADPPGGKPAYRSELFQDDTSCIPLGREV